MKPNFLIIGASKCATTSISNLLAQHPEIFVISKETRFFSEDQIFAKGTDWYESLYKDGEAYKARGDRNNLYTMKEVFPDTVERIFAYNPDFKLIYCVRNPIHRIESYWLQIRSHGGEDVHYDFNEAVHLNREWLVDASNYWQQINAFRKYFSDDQIMIVFYEDFRKSNQGVLKECYKFLEVDPHFSFSQEQIHLNPSAGKKIPSSALSKLRQYPLLRTGAKIIPPSIRKPLKQKLFFKSSTGKPTWKPETLEWALKEISEDTNKFLEFYGKSDRFWDLKAVDVLK
ncbi:sulfotransferase [Sphaerothrix gracilis]|uniref:sulfotransferase family protein n=1 Tax=Sphaerothrix gracilis TaxID=3151835 RepID=UPI0031FCDB5B